MAVPCTLDAGVALAKPAADALDFLLGLPAVDLGLELLLLPLLPLPLLPAPDLLAAPVLAAPPPLLLPPADRFESFGF